MLNWMKSNVLINGFSSYEDQMTYHHSQKMGVGEDYDDAYHLSSMEMKHCYGL